MAGTRSESHLTQFLNVDLDISSRSDLRPLVEALGPRMIKLHAGRERGRHIARLALARTMKNADATIRRLCKLIADLPPGLRRVWDAASTRDFSIGVQAGREPMACDFTVEPATVKAAADLNARIVFTVYAPDVGQSDSPAGL
jgi:hypothetical protein